MKFDMDAYVALALDPECGDGDSFVGMSLIFAEMVAKGLGLKDYEVFRDGHEVNFVSERVKFKLVQGILDSVVCLGLEEEKCYGWRDMDLSLFVRFLKGLD